MQQLHLALLGTFHLMTTGGATISLATDKVRGLLAYLAVEADRPHRREALAGLFWPDMPDQQARSNLRLSLHRLRQAVDEIVPGVSDTMLTVNRDVVQLHTAGLARDHQLFQQALLACDRHDHPELESCAECLQQLETAAALYRGEFLAGFSLDEGETFEDWLLVQREFLQQKALLALHTLTDMQAGRGDVEAALHYAQRQMALDPFYEPAYQQAMRVQALHGLRPQALALYEQCRQLLADELGVEPAPETTHLWQQIKDGSLQSIPARPAQTEIHHFPTPLTPFIGRQRELNEIVTTLANPACRVLTLLGPGGMGKTRLSLQVGHQLAGGTRLYRDGVYFIPLATVTEEDLLVTTIAQRLGLRLEEQTSPRHQLLAYLRDKEMLLVCDNFEQIVSGAPFVAEMVATAPQVQILLTSREPLNIQAEWRQLIRGLDVTGESSEAVELFQRSARRMVPNFQLRPGDGATVLELSRLVDGMPLALEIAAAWVRVMEPAAILRETKKSLDFLASPLQDMPERHQSVRAVLAQTWQLLATHLQGVLARMALFPAGFTLEAALAILPDVTMLDIATLLDKSLLHRLPQGRYEMHELLRQFALGQPQPQRYSFQERYSHYYLSLMGQQAETLRGRHPQSAITITQAELEHIRQAWQWAVEQQQVDLLRAAMSGLARFYHLAGLFQEAQQRLLATIQAVQSWPVAPGATLLLCELHAGASDFLGQSGQYEAAIRHAQAARQLAESAAAADLLAQTYTLEGEWRRHLSQFDEAKKALAQALHFYTAPAPTGEVAHVLNEIGFVHLKQSQYTAALTVFARARQIYEAVGDQTEISTTLGNIGYVYQLKAEYPQALDHLRQALAIAETIGYKQGIVKHTLGLGTVYLDQGDIAAARKAYEKTLQMAQGLGYVRGIINSLIQMGSTYVSKGQLQEAGQWFQKARTQAEAAGLRDLIALAIGKQATILALHGENQAAIAHYEQAIQLCRELNDQAELARNLSHLGNIYLRLGDPEQACQHFEAGLAVAQTTGAQQIVANTMLALGNAYKRLGQYDRALAYYQQLLTLSQTLGLQPSIANSIGSIGLVHFEQGNYEAARQAYEQALQLNQELGKALSEGLWWLNIGQVDMVMDRYESALQNTQQAITRFRALANQRYTAMGLLQQAQILFRQGQSESAFLVLTEALQSSEPFQEKQVLFEGYLLRARLWSALGEQGKARAQLDTMLGHYGSPAEQAQLHYDLWQLTGDVSSKETATTLYQQLLAQTPNHQYRQHLKALLAD
ncbi:MAG: tetratricopeptide repeat protein [Chloroflexi bacterium]|nr:tetratricopeptide repeat protein [Chloroflexota bacterium]MCI0647059.1 tetratricopeptide repeat protein [Chloroflexota bacterium]MCI0731546.1 tetratricopeptide repeat protein [Chloroflexota bacterium]